MTKRIHTIFITFLFSYVAILFVPIAISSFAYFEVERLLSENASVSELRMLKEIRRTLESELSDIRYLSWQISRNSRIQRFFETERGRTAGERLEASYLVKELMPYGTGHQLLWDFFLYFKNSDLVVTPSAVYEPDLFFGGVCVARREDPMEFYRYLRGFNEYFRCLPSAVFQGIDAPRELITIVQAVPSTRFYDPAAMLVAFIDARKLGGMIDEIYRGGYVCILDDHGKIILEKGERPSGLAPPMAALSGEDPDGFRFENRHVVSHTRTDDSMFRLYSVISEDTYLKTLNGYRNLILAVLAACFLVGLAAAYLLAYRNSRPLRQLIDTLTGTYGGKPDAARGEMAFIHDAVVEAFHKNRQLEDGYENIIKENREFKDQINKNTLLVRNGLLTRLIKGNVENGESLLDWLKINGVRFGRERFRVVLFHVDNYARLVEGGKIGDWSLFRFVFDLLARELSSRDQDGHPCELENDLLACLLNLSASAGEARQSIAETCQGIRGFMQRNYDIQLSVGIGCIVDDFRGIRLSYEKARDALAYGIIREKGAVTDCAEIVDEAKEYFYPIDEELAIIKAVKAADYDSCERILDRVFAENFENRKLPLASIRCLLFDIVGTAIKTLDQVRVNYLDAFGEGFEPVEELIEVENVPETMNKIRKVFGDVCAYLAEKRSDHNLLLRRRVMQYIEQNYLDVNLSQTRTAEALGISVPYLSRFFKQETGESMVEYINKLRLEQAKKLLLAGDTALADVAHAVGFGSDKTLIRLFKRYEGMTPGKFRESGRIMSILKRDASGS